MNSEAGSIVVKVWRVIVLVYTVGAKKSIKTPPRAQKGSTLRRRKRQSHGMVAEAVRLRVGPMAMTVLFSAVLMV